MFWRALFAFVAMPGVVAFGIPAAWVRDGHKALVHPTGLLLLAA